MTAYVDVPPEPWLPEQLEGRPHSVRRPPSPFREGGGGGEGSLVQYKSITSTPSEIAKDSLLELLEVPLCFKARQYDQLCQDFVEYLDKCEQKGFMIKGYDTKKGKILNLPMGYNNRWGEVRRRELSEKLKRLEFWFEMQEDRPVTMITLTSYQGGLTIGQAWGNLNKARGNLLKMLGKHLGKGLDYFWVPEPHKSGYVHYHMAVFADIPIELENKLRALWSQKYKVGSHTYGLDFSQKKNKDDKIQHLKNYLSKYLEKGFLIGKWTTGLLLFNAHLWETGFRMYGASKNIRDMMNIETERESHVVWLETRMQTVELTPEGEEVPIDKVIWYRQYIPDWLDSTFWLDINGVLRITDPPPLYLCDWGRRTIEGTQQHRGSVNVPELTERQKRKLAEDGYL